MGYKMKGSPAKLGTIEGTAGHASALKMKAETDAASALKDLGHGGHPNMTKSQAAAADHGGKRSLEERKKANTPKQYTEDKKPYVKKGGKATKNMKDLPLGSKERYAEYESRGWKHDDTTKGGEPDAAPAEPKKKVEVKKEIKEVKTKDKVEAKKPESDEGKKITPKERATTKGKKLRSKVKADVEAGKKGLGSKIRKYRAARKTKKNIKKYGVTPTADELT
jgi:hypothetical protein